MILKRQLLFIPLVFLLTSCWITDKTRHYLKGENGETLVNDTERSYHFIFNDYYVDSITNQPYTGIVTSWISPYNSPDNNSTSALDSICVFKGIPIGFKKTYYRPFDKNEKAEKITYYNFKNENFYELSASFFLLELDSLDKNVVSTNTSRFSINVNKKNLNVYCRIHFNNFIKKIKVEIEIVQFGSKYSKSMNMRQRAVLKSKQELQSYLHTFPDFIPIDALGKCLRLGLFDNKPVVEPIIMGKCNQ